MPKTRKQKEGVLGQAIEDAKEAKSMVFIGYHGLKVPELEDLRKKLREAGAKLYIIKKTILTRALKEAGMDIDVRGTGEGLAVAYGLLDEVAPAKILAKFQKEHEQVQVYGGVLEAKLIDTAVVTALAKLLSREELYAKVVGSINAPVSGFVNVLSSTVRSLVQVLNGIREAKI